MRKITVPEIRATKTNGRKLCLLTCYDYTSATIVEKSDIEMILIGDSLGMTMLGYEGTVGVTPDDIIHHGKAVRRGAPTTFIIGDMPFGSYNESVEQGIHTANRFMQEINCDAIKLEGGKRSAAVVKGIVEAGIPVCGHIGLTPQVSSNMGGFKVQGKSMDAVNDLLADAKAIEEAGAFMIMVEGVPVSVCKYLRDNINIPIIGIGAGKECEIQALIFQDMLGFTDWVPKFAKKYANLGPQMLDAFNTFHKEVAEGEFPTPEYSYNTKVEGLD
ncbi:3-methyl-2-oxobutanoate hydroxymethyltransferase [Lachnospiraceae bacterium NSJ-143]|nr:3-methyl-2-oxobutanoate hydroxymethyltransferase [Lachnospiraceae bacterium NSJ-143]